MYKLKLAARQCISCGICMDVCLPRAIAMRVHASSTIEGDWLTYLGLHPDRAIEQRPQAMMTFPYLAQPLLCDGCMLCVEECPVSALELGQNAGERVMAEK